MPIREEAINVFMGLPGDGDRLELTYNHGVDSYELGTGYNHIALTVDDIDGTLAAARRAGHRAREAAVPRARGRVADRVRPRSGRLSHRIDREELTRGTSPGSPSSTAGRTRSGWSSSPTPTTGGSARTRSTSPCASVRAWTRPASCSAEPMERALETLELYAHFCNATGIEDDPARRHVGDPRRRQPGGVPEGGAQALRAGDRGALRRGGGPLRVPGGGQLHDALPGRRARPRRRLDAAHARRGPRGDRAPLVAAGRGAHDRALPARGRQGQAQADEGAARSRRGGDRARARGWTRAGG